MKKAKKVLALVLSIVMLLSALPTAVFAAENEAEYVFSNSMQAFLSLESIVQLNVGFKLTADGADLSAAEAAALQDNVGLLVWKGETAPADAAIETCDVVLGAVYNAAKGRYEVKTDGIPAKELGDDLCFMPYYTDGMEYTYGRMIEGYSPKEYCYGQIAAGGSDTAVNAAILNYGAAAQEYFAYNTENLMNADLTEEQKALNWDGSLVRSEWAVPAEKEGELSRGAQIASRGGYLSLEGTIDVNFYFGADMDVADAEVLLWTEYAYNAAEVLAEENASLVKELTWNAEKSRYEYKYEGIAAKEMFSPVYACAKFTDAEGNVCYSGVVAYCAERYAYIAQNDADPALADLAKRIAIYGDAARTYFGNVELPDVGGGNQPEVPGINTDLTADVELTADGTVASEVSMSNGEVGATVPAGVAADKTTLTLQVSEKASSDADVEAGENETALSLDVHVDGVSASNTTAIIVKLGEILPKALNIGNVALYHVENGVTNEMTRVMTMEELDEHNEYYYDPVTGEVYVAMASFSEITMLAGEAVWEGKIADDFAAGSGTEEDPYIIANADQLARMSKLVSNDEAYAKAHYKLIADVNFDGDNVAANDLKDKVFYPIGYWKEQGTNDQGEIYYGHGNSFSGTFDGNGNAVRNIYQNTWLMDGDYEAGYWSAAMGLFGAVYDATIKNLTIDNFQSDGEFTPTGCVAAYAGGESVFENITLTNCNPRVYNTGNGGIVGLNYNSTSGTADQITFRNIAIDQTNKISALWGSYDVGCGGIMGRLRENSKHDGTNTDGQKNTVHFENCHVAAIMDVYNDVCANYQYYQYRYAGMMIGTVDYIGDVPEVGLTDVVTAEDCTVTYGDWNEYWYCELVKNSLASYTHDHQFSRLTEIASLDEIKSGETWLKEGNFVLPNEDNTAAECYHIFKDSENNLYQHFHDAADATNPDIFETSAVDGDSNGFDSVAGKYLKEDRQRYYIPFGQLFTGYGWGSSPVRDGYAGITITDDDSNLKAQEKFTYIGAETIAPNEAITIGELFEASVATEKISKTTVQVFVSPVGEESTVDATYASKTDWTQGTLTFTGTGAAKLVITDYYYCTPTVVYITVGEEVAEPAEKFTAKTVETQNAYTQITLGELFAAKDGVSIGNVTATITVNGEAHTTVTGTNSEWTGKTIDLTKDGQWTVSIKDDDKLCLPTEVTFNVNKADKFTNKFDKDFLYRVGNDGNVALTYLFSENYANIAPANLNVKIVNVAGNASGTYTANETDWDAGYIKFSNTGVVKVTISADGANAVELNLEVVNATNRTTASFGGNSVLLQDVSTSGTLSTSGVVYGNGFTVNMENAPVSEKNGAVFHLYDGAILKNLAIVGKEFTSVAMTVNDTNYGVSTVRAWGTVLIENCYISGCRSAVSVTGTELTIKDSVIANGVYSNVDFRSGILNLHNVTTINEPHAVDGKTIVGLGIVGNMTASAGRQLNITGTLTQYNWVSQADCSNIKASGIDTIFNSVFTDSKYADLRYTYNGTTYVNTGILSLCGDFGASAVTGLPTNYSGMQVSATIAGTTINDGYVWTYGQAGTLTAADMAYHDKTYAWASNNQGTSYVAPAFDFTGAGVEAENGVVQISYENGSSYTLSAATIKALLSPTKYGQALDCRITMNGTDYTNKDIVFDASASQTYTITYTVVDDFVYDKLGNLTSTTYEVSKDLKVFATVVDKSADAPTFTFYYGTNGKASAGTPHTAQPTNSYTSAIKKIGEGFYIMPNVSATTANAIGSQTVGTETVYYPIVDGINVRSGKSTDYDFTRYYPVFKAVKISDNGTEYTYSETKEMPATVSWVSAEIDSGNGASSLNDGFGLYNNQYLCKIQKKAGDAEGGGTSVVKYSYTAQDGNTYIYYVGYRFYDEDEGGVCVTPDTLITLADGSQVRADALTGNEELLVWNHTTGAYDVAPIAYIVNHDDWYGEMEVMELMFSDGTTLNIIGEHVFYDATENRYVAVTTDDAEAYIGHSFARTDIAGETLKLVELVAVERSVYETNLYEIVTDKHLTCFTNDILSAAAYLDPLLNIFDIDTETFAYDPAKMMEDIETYGLYTYADFEGLISEEAFELYNAAYLKIAVGKGYIDWDTILELIDIYFAVDVQPIA